MWPRAAHPVLDSGSSLSAHGLRKWGRSLAASWIRKRNGDSITESQRERVRDNESERERGMRKDESGREKEKKKEAFRRERIYSARGRFSREAALFSRPSSRPNPICPWYERKETRRRSRETTREGRRRLVDTCVIYSLSIRFSLYGAEICSSVAARPAVRAQCTLQRERPCPGQWLSTDYAPRFAVNYQHRRRHSRISICRFEPLFRRQLPRATLHRTDFKTWPISRRRLKLVSNVER